MQVAKRPKLELGDDAQVPGDLSQPVLQLPRATKADADSTAIDEDSAEQASASLGPLAPTMLSEEQISAAIAASVQASMKIALQESLGPKLDGVVAQVTAIGQRLEAKDQRLTSVERALHTQGESIRQLQMQHKAGEGARSEASTEDSASSSWMPRAVEFRICKFDERATKKYEDARAQALFSLVRAALPDEDKPLLRCFENFGHVVKFIVEPAAVFRIAEHCKFLRQTDAPKEHTVMRIDVEEPPELKRRRSRVYSLRRVVQAHVAQHVPSWEVRSALQPDFAVGVSPGGGQWKILCTVRPDCTVQWMAPQLEALHITAEELE